jgi:Universal stress protein family
MHVIERSHPADVSRSTDLLPSLIASEAALWCTPEFVVETGEPAEKILDLAGNRRVDLIVMGAHQMRGLAGAPTHLAITTAHKVAGPVSRVDSSSLNAPQHSPGGGGGFHGFGSGLREVPSGLCTTVGTTAPDLFGLDDCACAQSRRPSGGDPRIHRVSRARVS